MSCLFPGRQEFLESCTRFILAQPAQRRELLDGRGITEIATHLEQRKLKRGEKVAAAIRAAERGA